MAIEAQQMSPGVEMQQVARIREWLMRADLSVEAAESPRYASYA